LGNPYQNLPPLDEFDDFHLKRRSGYFLLENIHEEIKRFVMLEGFDYDKSDAGREHRAQYKFMTNPAKLIQKFILYNVMPNSHMSDCVTEVCPLNYYILKDIKVDITRTIAWEMKKVVLQGKTERESRLFFPGLILGLIKGSGMRLPTAVHEKIPNPINDAFIARHIMGETKKAKGKGKQASSSRTPQSAGPIPFPTNAPFDFVSYAQWQHQSNMHTWEMLAATNRANTYFQQSQYVMQQQSGYPQEVMDQFMTPQAFQTYVNWPGDIPGPYGGGGFYAGDVAEDVGDGCGNEEDLDRDDPDRVPSATPGSEDEDMESLDRGEEEKT
jgi:hypothetical protein